MEVSHRDTVRLIGIGSETYLEHTSTGELQKLPDGSAYELKFDGEGFGYVVVRCEVSVEGMPLETKHIYIREYLKTSLHEDAHGKKFIRKGDGATVWLDAFAEGHRSYAFHICSGRDTLYSLKAWVFDSAVGSVFVFWDLPYVVNSLWTSYTYACLKRKIHVCHLLQLAVNDGKHFMPSVRSL